MPYAGPRDQGAGIFQAFLAGDQNRRERQQAKQLKALQDAQMELQEAASRRANQQLNISARDADLRASEAIQQRSIRENEDRRAQGREDRSRRGFNLDVEDRARKQEEKHALDKANEFVGGMELSALGEALPELQPDIDQARQAIDELGDISPLARGIAATNAAKILKEKSDTIGHQKATAAFNDWIATGGGADANGDSSGAMALQESINDPKVPWQSKMKAMVDYSKEQSKRAAKVQANQLARQRLGALFLGEGGQQIFEPGSQEEMEARAIVEESARGLPEATARRQIFEIMHRKDREADAERAKAEKASGAGDLKDKDLLISARYLVKTGQAKDVAEGVEKTRAVLGKSDANNSANKTAPESAPNASPNEAKIKAASEAFKKKNGRLPTVSELKAIVEGAGETASAPQAVGEQWDNLP